MHRNIASDGVASESMDDELEPDGVEAAVGSEAKRGITHLHPRTYNNAGLNLLNTV